MPGTNSSLDVRGRGFAVLQAGVNLQPTASGTWTDTPLTVDLPGAGTYHLDAVVRAFMVATTPAAAYIVARLWDVQAGAVVPTSQTMAGHLSMTLAPTTTAATIGRQQDGMISVPHTVPGPRTVRLQAARVNQQGATSQAWVASDANGWTTLRWERVE